MGLSYLFYRLLIEATGTQEQPGPFVGFGIQGYETLSYQWTAFPTNALLPSSGSEDYGVDVVKSCNPHGVTAWKSVACIHTDVCAYCFHRNVTSVLWLIGMVCHRDGMRRKWQCDAWKEHADVPDWLCCGGHILVVKALTEKLIVTYAAKKWLTVFPFGG
jgi:hypothetical protein